MSQPAPPKPTSRFGLILFLILFIGTAAWGGWVLASKGAQRSQGKSSNPYEDRSLFGR